MTLLTTLNATRTPLPAWLTALRPWQEEAITDIADAFDSGVRFVIMDAPTGTGKTVIAEGVRKLLEVRHGLCRGVFSAHSKSLQEQFLKDFPYSSVLMGKSNYNVLDEATFPYPEFSCDDCEKEKDDYGEWSCRFCPMVGSCPYTVAKTTAENAEVMVLNHAYMLYGGKYAGVGTDRDLHVVDECETILGTLSDFAGVVIPKRMAEGARIDPPSNVSDIPKLNALLPDWSEYAREKLGVYKNGLTDEKAQDKVASIMGSLANIKADPNVRWLVEGVNRENKAHNPKLTIKAVHTKPIAYAATDMMQRGLFMSATTISPELLAEDLGMEAGEWRKVIVPSPFEPTRRPVVIYPNTPALSRKNLQDGLPERTRELLYGVLTHHQDERVLIHVPSYSLARDVMGWLRFNAPGRRHVTYNNAREREGAIAEWLDTDAGVFVASSLARGLDLKGDLCRAQVVLKLHFPSLGSPHVKALMYVSSADVADGIASQNVGDTWYAIQTLRELVQAAGRVCRSADDYGVTYILDGAVMRLHKQNRQYFPKWFEDAVTNAGKPNSKTEQYSKVSSTGVYVEK